MPLTKTVSVPSQSDGEPSDKRLWIGNLDSRITEYYLLKLLQRHGQIEKFDMMFHRSGPLCGQPRGYAFVTYASKDTAENVKSLLDGKKMGSKCVAVRWAHNMNKDEMKNSNDKLKEITALTGAKSERKLSRTTTIQAIEAKLKMMEDSSAGDFTLNVKPGTSNSTISLPKSNSLPKTRHNYKPYNKISK